MWMERKEEKRREDEMADREMDDGRQLLSSL
jgi:hypothetical protein